MPQEEAEAHLERAKRAYRAAVELHKLRLLEDAYSRAYYALLHLGFAMLVEAGETLPKTHGGLVAKLYSKREKLKLDEAVVRKISRFQSLRANSDYSPVPALTAKDFNEITGVLRSLFAKIGVDVG